MGQFESYGLQPLGEIGLPKRGNRASLERFNNPKPKAKRAAAPASPPRRPPEGPENRKKDKGTLKEPSNYKKKRPPEEGMGALVRK
jgi:hypothetical protein